LDSMASVASETYTATSAPIQYAAVRAFEDDLDLGRYLNDSRRILSAMGNSAAKRLLDCGVDVFPPDGAFYLFPDFEAFRDNLAARDIRSSAEMCRRLLEDTGVAILPGSDFGRSPGELTARLAYVDFDGAAALKAAAEIPPDEVLGEGFLHKHCGNLCRATDLICEWINS